MKLFNTLISLAQVITSQRVMLCLGLIAREVIRWTETSLKSGKIISFNFVDKILF